MQKQCACITVNSRQRTTQFVADRSEKLCLKEFSILASLVFVLWANSWGAIRHLPCSSFFRWSFHLCSYLYNTHLSKRRIHGHLHNLVTGRSSKLSCLSQNPG